jgi:hypothetical protein
LNTTNSQILGIYNDNNTIKITEFIKPNLYIRSTSNGNDWDKKIISTSIRNRKTIKNFMFISGNYCVLTANDIFCNKDTLNNIPKESKQYIEFQDMAYNGNTLIISGVNFSRKENRIFRTSNFKTWNYTDITIEETPSKSTTIGYILKQIVFWKNKFVGVTVDGRVCISDSGRTWNWISFIKAKNEELFYHLHKDGDRLVASTWSSGYMFQSMNAKIWDEFGKIDGGDQLLYPRFSLG